MDVEAEVKLMERVAQNLAGRPVTVRVRYPTFVARQGQAYNAGGRAVIDLSPELKDYERFSVFLHECAHILHDWPDLPAVAVMPSGSLGSAEYNKKVYAQPNIKASESRADDVMRTWRDYSLKHAGDSIAERLKVLLYYMSPEKEAELKKIVSNGIAEGLRRAGVEVLDGLETRTDRYIKQAIDNLRRRE